MNHKKQFKSGEKTPQFYDRRVRHEGATRSLSLGKVIPKHWIYVRITILEQNPEYIKLGILKLAGDEQNEPKESGSKP